MKNAVIARSDALRHALPGCDFGRGLGTAGSAGAGESLGGALSSSLPMLLAAGAHPAGPRAFESERIANYRVRRRFDAMDHRCPADFPDPHSFHAHLHDAVRTAADCLSLPQAGARPADYAIQPDSHWLVGDHDLLSHAADRRRPSITTRWYRCRKARSPPSTRVARGGVPMRQFMSHYVREKDVALFLEMAKEPRPANINDVSFRVLLPAYILSELKAGFQIGAVLFLPFLVVDMVVASITTSVGMMQLPPVVISTPLKLLLFLMVDGWHLLIGALMRSFN